MLTGIRKEGRMEAVVSEKRYIKEGGSICLFCESEHLDYQDLDGNYGTVWQKVSCAECGEQWEEVYSLTEVRLC